jgi:cyanophycinase
MAASSTARQIVGRSLPAIISNQLCAPSESGDFPDCRARRWQNRGLRSRGYFKRMCASKVAEGGERGWIIPIGGAEEKENSPQILRRFVELCGGEAADIAVIPTASLARGTAPRYESIFSEMGAQRVASLDFDTRRDAEEPSRLERLRQASGVFFTGGNQLRLSTLIGGTPVAKAVRQMNAAGVPVAGTSAGAAFLCEHMIAFGDEGSTPVAGSVRLAPGLGLTNRFIIDQHFRQRDRLGRLLTALAYNPFAVGIGLDEDTAAFISPDNTVQVEGSGGITVVDAAEVQFSSMDTTEEGRPVCLLGLKLHILAQGATFNLNSRVADAGALVQSKR